VVVLDSPWAGQTFSPATALDIATVESQIVAQLKSYLATALGTQMVEVAHFPDKPEAYEMRHRIGVALVIYSGSDFGEVLDIGNVAQERRMEFAVGVRIRDLGWAYGGPPGGTSPGAYQVLETIRAALTGFQPSTGCSKMRPLRERFVDRDRQGGVWVYESTWETRTIAVENYQAPAFPLLLTGTAQEEGNITVAAVPMAQVTFSGTPGAIMLAHGNISQVVVQSQNGAQTYVLNTDYSLDTVNGIITRLATGAIAAAATVRVTYSYAEVVTALASGGTVPFAPHN